jgi:DNA-binding transcriptional LysR family regulator
MDLQDMRIFSRVAAVQNLSSVGLELGLTPGTISKRIQSLEEELSARLFDRTTRSIRITEEGSKFLEYVERILLEIEKAKAVVTANVDQPRGRLRISAPASFGDQFVAPAICAFMQSFPEIEVQVDLSDRVVNLQEDGYDVVIRVGTLSDSALIAKRLAPYPMLLAASPAYLKQHGLPKTPDELERHSCLVLGEAMNWSFVRDQDETIVRVGGRLRSDNGDLLLHAAVQGLGIVRVSELHARELLRRNELRRVLPDYDVTLAASIWAVYPSTKHVLPKLRVFLDFIGDWFRDVKPGCEKPSSFNAVIGMKTKALGLHKVTSPNS